MKVRTKRNIYLSVSIAFVAIILTCVYYFLGGFKEVEVFRMLPGSRTIAGKYFTPVEYKRDGYEHGTLCKELIENGQLPGVLTTVVMMNDSLPGEEAGRFIGISLDQDVFEVPEGFEIIDFYTGEARFAAMLTMHFLVRPTQPDIEQMLQEAAVEAGYPAGDTYFHLNYQDGSAIVEAWVLE